MWLVVNVDSGHPVAHLFRQSSAARAQIQSFASKQVGPSAAHAMMIALGGHKVPTVTWWIFYWAKPPWVFRRCGKSVSAKMI